MLPTNDADRAIIARAMGYGSFDGLLAELDDHRAAVARHFEAVFADPNRGEHKLAGMWRGAGGEDQGEEFAKLGYRQPREAAARVAALREGPRYQQLAAGIRERFDALVPQLIQAAAEMPNPDATLSRSLDLLESISRRAAYLALLQQYPQALRKVAELVSSSSWAADYLQRHPILLDELLDPRLLDVLPDWSGVRAALESRLAELEPDTERQMDLLRETHHAQVFRLLAQDVAGLYTVEAGRPPFGTGRHPARRGPAPRLAQAAEAPCRAAEVRRHQLRQARRQGTRLRLRPRPGLPLRRPGAGSRRELRPARHPAQHLALGADRRRPVVRDRPAAAAQRRIGPGGQLDGGLPQVPARIGLGLGTPGADPRPLLGRRSGRGRGLREDPLRSAVPAARPRASCAPTSSRCGRR
jgi:hypothetical protein